MINYYNYNEQLKILHTIYQYYSPGNSGITGLARDGDILPKL